ncbi:hypothetical protein IGI04_015402 [Brassica rapa subsp. trilocularis]|uniref:Uncharacterized protein n=1 Tax=Brassica rapa subsp. trilocularis TaxID=1813537 RepID=A0ABQ7MSG0_BRACM|nr:hypothetical protein IGI04_015402 [Brassica rapa subsp. trilocularis]
MSACPAIPEAIRRKRFYSQTLHVLNVQRKERLATSIDINSTSSTDTCERAPIDTSHSVSINTNPRADMVVNLVLIHDEIGDLHDHEGYPRNAAGQRIGD